MTIAEDQLDDFSDDEVITYIEKSKQLVFTVVQGRIASCINPVQAPPLQLTGKGVLTAVIDSGIDYTHRDFRNPDGTTRIHALWDQTAQGMPPEGYDRGALYTKEDINNALAAETAEERKRIVPSEDRSGHGTAVAGIMAGNGSSSGGVNRGAAPGSELLVVKMGMTNEGGFPRTTELMLELDFVIREAIHAGKPVAVNVSFGNSYGAHDGSSLLESYIDTVSQIWKNNIIIAAGNNAVSAGHFRAVMISEKTLDADISVSEYERSLNVQIWKYYGDEADIEIISPSGESDWTNQKDSRLFSSGNTQRFYCITVSLHLFDQSGNLYRLYSTETVFGGRYLDDPASSREDYQRGYSDVASNGGGFESKYGISASGSGSDNHCTGNSQEGHYGRCL